MTRRARSRRRALCRVPTGLMMLGLAGCLDGASSVPDRGEPSGIDPGVTTGETDGSPVVPGVMPEDRDPDRVPDDPVPNFIDMPDGGPAPPECDLFAQDCPPGMKCMPWANDGGPAWNSTRCSPIADDPGGEGDVCTVEESGVSGIDDCDIGLMCWRVDERGVGYCEDICTGSADNPICDEPDEFCTISGSGAIVLCIDICDPLAQDCQVENEVCYPINDNWSCVPDASGEWGTYGDPCRYINACDEGNVCLGAAAFSDCVGAVGCCSALCNVHDRQADAMCTALDPQQRCEPWYLEGMAPPGYESVGVCAVPP